MRRQTLLISCFVGIAVLSVISLFVAPHFDIQNPVNTISLSMIPAPSLDAIPPFPYDKAYVFSDNNSKPYPLREIKPGTNQIAFVNVPYPWALIGTRKIYWSSDQHNFVIDTGTSSLIVDDVGHRLFDTQRAQMPFIGWTGDGRFA